MTFLVFRGELNRLRGSSSPALFEPSGVSHMATFRLDHSPVTLHLPNEPILYNGDDVVVAGLLKPGGALEAYSYSNLSTGDRGHGDIARAGWSALLFAGVVPALGEVSFGSVASLSVAGYSLRNFIYRTLSARMVISYCDRIKALEQFARGGQRRRVDIGDFGRADRRTGDRRQNDGW